MRSIYFTEDHEAFRRTVRRFMEEEVAPQAEAWEAARRIPREIFRRMGELGFLGIMFPEAYGGSEADIFFAVVFLEELPRSRMGGFCAAVSVQQFMATQHIFRHGSEELKQRYLAPSIEGKLVGALAISEPDIGSDVASLRTRAVREGDHYRIDGSKMFITNGAEGDFYTLAVRTGSEPGAGGISLIVVDADLPGVSVSRRLEKLGWHSSDTAGLSFEGVRVPVSRLVGEENAGFYYLMECFQLERLCGAAIAVGSAQLCLQTTLGYMRERKVFGKPLTRYAALTHRLADLAAELEAARQLVYHAAWLLEQGDAAVRECTMAKLVATELGKRVADQCLQCFGGYGFMEEYPLARHYRDARAATIAAGTSEIMREILARMMADSGPAAASPGRSATASPQAARRAPEPAGEEPRSAAAVSSPGAAAAPAAATDTVTVDSLIRSLPARFMAERAGDWSARFHYVLEGARKSRWTVIIENGRCEIREGHEGEPDCMVSMDIGTYMDVELGHLDPQTAFMSGKIRVSNLQPMLRFISLFRPLTSSS